MAAVAAPTEEVEGSTAVALEAEGSMAMVARTEAAEPIVEAASARGVMAVVRIVEGASAGGITAAACIAEAPAEVAGPTARAVRPDTPVDLVERGGRPALTARSLTVIGIRLARAVASRVRRPLEGFITPP